MLLQSNYIMLIYYKQLFQEIYKFLIKWRASRLANGFHIADGKQKQTFSSVFWSPESFDPSILLRTQEKLRRREQSALKHEKKDQIASISEFILSKSKGKIRNDNKKVELAVISNVNGRRRASCRNYQVKQFKNSRGLEAIGSS